MRRSNYSYKFVNGVLVIYDNYSDFNPTLTVTNNAENVILEIQSKHKEVNLIGCPIIYQDSGGDWDQMIWDGVSVRFNFLMGTSESECLNEVLKSVDMFEKQILNQAILTIGKHSDLQASYVELMNQTPYPEMVRITCSDIVRNRLWENVNCVDSIVLISEYMKILRTNGYVNLI